MIVQPDGEINTTKDEESGRTFYVPELDDERRPFRAILDVGIRTTSTGNRVFGVLKGASDGGLDIPHNSKRFPGASGKSYSAEDHKDRIFGQHVAEYMTLLADVSRLFYMCLPFVLTHVATCYES